MEIKKGNNMLRKSKTITISGSSVITLSDGTEKIVASYSGSISNDNYSINKYVSDNELYNKYFNECRIDYNEFEDYARTFIKGNLNDNYIDITDSATVESIKSTSESESLSTSESESYSESTSESESDNTTN